MESRLLKWKPTVLGIAIMIVPVVAATVACGGAAPRRGERSTPSRHAIPPAVGVAPAPGEPLTVPARFALSIRDGQPAGGVYVAAFKNIDRNEYRHWHPGGRNGCAVFRWDISITDERGRTFREPGRAPGAYCAAVMVPEQWIVVKPGDAVTLAIDTSREFTVVDPNNRLPWTERPRGRLGPGKFRIRFAGPGVEAFTNLTIP